jgi:hypothetical protein
MIVNLPDGYRIELIDRSGKQELRNTAAVAIPRKLS